MAAKELFKGPQHSGLAVAAAAAAEAWKKAYPVGQRAPAWACS